MSYHQDWFMRQIRQLIEALARVLLGKDIREERTACRQWQTLESLLRERGICPAEDALLEGFDPEDPDWLEAGLLFYSRINELTDEELAAQNFSRQEIREGLETISNLRLE